MERFRVVGGTSLVGEVSVVGAKNSALKLMAGSLLAVGKTHLSNVPAITIVWNPDPTAGATLGQLGSATDFGAVTPINAAWATKRLAVNLLSIG